MDACRQTSCLAREGAELSGQGRQEAHGESREVSQGMSLRGRQRPTGGEEGRQGDERESARRSWPPHRNDAILSRR